MENTTARNDSTTIRPELAARIEGLARRNDNIVAHGESGHWHAAEGAGISVWDKDGDGVATVLDAPNGARLTHQEHDTLELPPSNVPYKVSRVQETDHINAITRNVID